MGLFDKISKAFEKKECAVCGAEIGLFGNNKLADANMCDDCRRKLSPFFTKTRQSTLEQINEQLAYREENKARVAKFKTTRVIGNDNVKVMVDEDSACFMVMPDAKADLKEANPDVIELTQLVGCSVDVDEDEHKEELKYKNGKGEQVSFTPPRYKYHWSYDVYVNIDVQHPYFDRIRLHVNRYSIDTQTRNISTELDNARRTANQIQVNLNTLQGMTRRKKVQENAPKKAVNCPFCGASTIPDKNGCCEYCGSSLNG